MSLLQHTLSALIPQKAPTTPVPDTLNLRSYGQEKSALSLVSQPVMEWVFLPLAERDA